MDNKTFIVKASSNGDTYKTKETISSFDLNNPENFGIKNIEILLKIKTAGNSNMTIKKFLRDYGYLENSAFNKMSRNDIKTLTNDILNELFDEGPAGFDYIEI